MNFTKSSIGSPTATDTIVIWKVPYSITLISVMILFYIFHPIRLKKDDLIFNQYETFLYKQLLSVMPFVIPKYISDDTYTYNSSLISTTPDRRNAWTAPFSHGILMADVRTIWLPPNYYHGGPSEAGDCRHPPPKMATAENPISGKGAFNHVAGHGSLSILACEQVLDMVNLWYRNGRSPLIRIVVYLPACTILKWTRQWWVP